MADYKNMYSTLFNKITDVVKELQEIQQLTEEIYMQAESKIIELSIMKEEKIKN